MKLHLHPWRALGTRLLALAGIFSVALAARAVVPWSIAINTNFVIVVTNAVGDNSTDNTLAISNAIVAAAKGGKTNNLYGGTVEIPTGTNVYLCGPIYLTNNVNLQIDAGAVLRMLSYDSYPGGITNPPDFINGSYSTNIEISGSGAVDGQGAPWWPGYHTNSRPNIVAFNHCNYQLVQNITLSNSPQFHMAFSNSRGNITVQGVTVRAPDSATGTLPQPSHNTDACDVSGTNVLVQNCDISTGDDDFTCGGGTSDVLITNNTYGDGHGVSIGSYTQGVSNIMVINCTFNGTQNGIRIKSDNDRSGIVQNISYFNLGMTNVNFPIQIYGYYNEIGTPSSVSPDYAATQAVAAVVSTTPVYRNITFSNITGTSVSTYPIGIIWARTEMPATNIVFDKVNLTGDESFDVYNVSGAQFIDCNLKTSAGQSSLLLYNATAIITNSAPTNTLFTFDGLTTNGYGNTLAFYNATGSLINTNAFDNGPLTLAASTFIISNNLTLFPTTVLNFTLGTNTTKLAVTGNLTLGGTNNIYAGAGFTNGTYTVMTYSNSFSSLSGNLPTLGTVPAGYTYAYETNTAGTVKLVVTLNALPPPAAPTNLVAVASNATVTLTWSASATATNYNVKRSTTSGTGYAPIATVAVTNYTDLQVTNGTTYFYVVSALGVTGESTNSAEANATPQSLSYIVVTTNVFTDTFGSSTLNGISVPTTNSTSYDIASTKNASSTYSFIAPASKLRLSLSSATSSGFVEAQALFTANPVTLATVGDCLNLTYTFTNVSGTLLAGATNSLLVQGLFNSGGSVPVAGALANAGLSTATGSTYATNNCANWMGYVAQIANTNGYASKFFTRPLQNGAGTTSANQDLLFSAVGSGAFNNPAGTQIGNVETVNFLLTAGATYTISYSIALTASGIFTVTNNLYGGADITGPLVFSQTNTTTVGTYLTNAFDGLAIGVRNAGLSFNPTLDISKIAVTSTLSVAITNNPPPLPPAPTGLTASATNLLINLKWNSVSGATNYNLKRGTTSGIYPTVFSGLTATNYADANVTNAVNYFYVVTAVSAGGESTNSWPANATPLPSNQPTNLTAQVVGNQLQLSWPPDHLGWRLLIQTNNLGQGLSSNWATVPNSTNIMTTNIVINPANGAVFLRLVYP